MIRKISQTILCPLLVLGSLLGGLQAEPSRNIWPFWNEWTDASGKNEQWQSMGPLVFGKKKPDGTEVNGVRPFFVEMRNEEAQQRQFYSLYPLWTYREDQYSAQWSILTLIRGSKYTGNGGVTRDFDAFPIIWYRDHPDPERSYAGLFPFGGTIKNRMWSDRIDWVMFPLFSRYENKGEVVYSMPWPFLRWQTGAGSKGMTMWPFFSHRYKEGVYNRKYILWPIYYDHKEKLDEPVPTHKMGVLPFYASYSSAKERSVHYPWPFYGYSERFDPYYRENHYLWPLWLTGEGEKRHEQRWLPLYSHSLAQDPYREKRWYAWPLVRLENYEQQGLMIEKEQLLFFVFWNMRQYRIGNPEGPVAQKTHIWPFSSSWNSGDGREQFQLFSPFEVFFPRNEAVRELYTPLFSIYRKDIDHNTERYRHDFLFNLITWEEDEANQRLDIGPILQQRSGEEGFSLTLLHGLLGWSRQNGEGGLHLFWFRL